MKNISLVSFKIDHFQGGVAEFNFNGESVNIYGQNRSGKTRTFSALTWLLWGKDSLQRSDFSVKDLNADGEVAEHGIDHSVSGIFDVDGERIELRRVLRELWVKKRGSASSIFNGHRTDFFIQGVPKSEKEYKEFISDMAGSEETFRLITSPTAFSGLPWQKARSILLDVCGDISTEEVVESNPRLSSLPAILGKRTIDDARKVITARRSEINKEMERIPVRIDEQHRSLPDVTGIDRTEAEKEAQRIETALNEAKLRLQGINTGGLIADLSKKLSGLNAELRKMEDSHRSGSMATLNRLNQQISEVDAQINALKRRIAAYDGDLKQKEGQVQRLDSEMSRLRGQWTETDSQTFTGTIIDTCPTCRRPLPQDQVQETKDRAIANFNEWKAEHLGTINDKGKDLKEQRTRLQGEIDALKKEQEIASVSLPASQEKLKTLIDERDSLKRSSEDFSGIQGRAEILDEIEDVEGQIKEEREGKAADLDKIKGEIETLSHDLCLEKAKVDAFVRREQGEARVIQLKAEEKVLSMEFEKLEGQLYLIEQFIRAKVAMLTDRINEKFDTVRFKLFDLQVNGALAECCTITVGGVPFDSGLNNGARINAGLEIVKVLQEHYQLRAPVFADNAEAVNKLVEVGCQMIRLYVSEDKQLRVEYATKERKAA